jgi:hypothetical protein
MNALIMGRHLLVLLRRFVYLFSLMIDDAFMLFINIYDDESMKLLNGDIITSTIFFFLLYVDCCRDRGDVTNTIIG